MPLDTLIEFLANNGMFVQEVAERLRTVDRLDQKIFDEILDQVKMQACNAATVAITLNTLRLPNEQRLSPEVIGIIMGYVFDGNKYQYFAEDVARDVRSQEEDREEENPVEESKVEL